MNLLIFELQGRRSDLATCARKIEGYMAKCKKNVFASCQNFNTTVSTSECIAACIVHLDGLHVDFERRSKNDPIKIVYPLWLVVLENHEP